MPGVVVSTRSTGHTHTPTLMHGPWPRATHLNYKRAAEEPLQNDASNSSSPGTEHFLYRLRTQTIPTTLTLGDYRTSHSQYSYAINKVPTWSSLDTCSPVPWHGGELCRHKRLRHGGLRSDDVFILTVKKCGKCWESWHDLHHRPVSPYQNPALHTLRVAGDLGGQARARTQHRQCQAVTPRDDEGHRGLQRHAWGQD